MILFWNMDVDWCDGAAGTVVFSEVMTLPNGMSKGCGVVEYSSADEAQRAIRELSDKTLMGRQVFIREDREDEARYGAAAVSERGVYPGARGRGSFPRGGGFGGRGGGSSGSRQLYVGGLNAEVGWQDLKDLFRQAGDIVRADVKFDESGMPSGTGNVLFTNASDAQNAITMFNGAELNGMKLEVREERFSAPTSGPFAGGAAGGRDGYDYHGSGSGGGGYESSRPVSSFPAPQPSPQIFVKNLPWSTTNDDLVELFQTTGTVQAAEVLWEGGRSKGVGVIQFASQEEAETAIKKFQLYNYGGRPLSIEYNGRWRDFNAMPPVEHSTSGY